MIESQERVIGTAIVYPQFQVMIASSLESKMFGYPYASVFASIVEAVSKGTMVSHEDLAQSMGRSGWQRSEAIRFLNRCVAAASPGLIDSDVKSIIDEERKTRLHGAILSAQSILSDGGDVDEAARVMYEASSASGKIKARSIREIASSAYDSSVARKAAGGKIIGYEFPGIQELSIKIDGFQPGFMYTIGGTPGSGKTAMALEIAWSVCAAGKKPLIFSADMSAEQMLYRLAGKMLNETATSLKGGRVSDNTLGYFKSLIETGAFDKFIIEDRQIYPSEMASITASSGDIGCIILDYVQISPGQTAGKDPNRDVTEVSLCMQSLAKKYNIPVILLSQLTKEVDSSPMKRPALGHLLYGNALRQHSRVVLLLYNPGTYGLTVDMDNGGRPFPVSTEERSYIEISIAKNNEGSQGVIPAYFLPRTNSFAECKTPTPSRPGNGQFEIGPGGFSL